MASTASTAEEESPAGSPARSRRLDRILAPLLFVVLGAVFYLSPVRHLSDPRFTMLLAEELLVHGSFDLAPYFADDAVYRDLNLHMRRGLPRHVRRSGPQVFYIYPYGTSVLSVPFLAGLRALGYSAVDADGRYASDGEMEIHAVLAAFISALTGLIFYALARQVLAPGWSAAVALAGALGSQLWSTASRAMWSHTWGLLLLSLALLALLREERRSSIVGGRPPWWHLPCVATLLAWSFIVRPTALAYVVPIAVYVVWRQRRRSWAFLAVGAAWLIGFLVHSRLVFGEPLPDYYQRGDHLTPDNLALAVGANLVSPGRGLLVYSPWVMLALFLVIRHWRHLRHRGLVVTAFFIFAIHLLVVSGNRNWWAGNCYGPRLMTETLPLWVLLAAIGWRAALDRPGAERKRAGLLRTAAALLVLTSWTLHGAGALSYGWVEWHTVPEDISWQPMRVFDWRQAQFRWALDPERAARVRRAAERERWPPPEPESPSPRQ